MGQIQWGTDKAREELSDLMRNAQHAILDLNEEQYTSRIFGYSLTVASNNALRFVQLGPREKNTTLDTAVKTHRRAYERRRKVSELLCVPDHLYSQEGEKILPAFGQEDLAGHDGKHLSPPQELILVRDVLSIAHILGFDKIARLGQLPPTADYQAALAYLANEEHEQMQDFNKGSHEA